MKESLIKVTGKVQGVFFRAECCKKAIAFGLTGYAKNMPDGSVEILAQGDKIDELIEWARDGSTGSRVENVEVVQQEFGEALEGFKSH